MNISMLNVKIEIQKAVGTVDDIGNHISEWAKHYSCYATVSGESGKEQLSAGNIEDNAEIAFTVRYCNALADIDPTSFRVVFGGDIYDIIGIDHMNYKRKSLKIRCAHAR